MSGQIVCVSEHAYLRARERLGLNRRSFLRLSRKAYAEGIRHGDTKGTLKKYIDGLWMKNKAVNNARIYGENIFLFQEHFLITVYRIPNELIRYLRNFKD